MKASSLLGIALELIENLARPGPYPSDARVGRFTRERRYLGSRDRRFVSETAWTWLRFELRARRIWREETEGVDLGVELPSDEEIRALEGSLAGVDSELAILRSVYWLDLLVLSREGHLAWGLEEILAASQDVSWPEGGALDLRPARDKVLAGSVLAPAPLPRAPRSAAEQLALEASLPDWIARILIDERGEDEAFALGRALLEPATVDLRVNRSRKSRERVRSLLESEAKRPVALTPHSPLGLRIAGRTNLTGTTASREGWIEVQDEGSQIVALVCDVTPDLRVIDACAGTGGKTLALADLIAWPLSGRPAHRPSGRVWASDISRNRLGEIERRAAEAKLADRVVVVPIFPAGPLPEVLPEADIVLVDAPCTGLGTLRRNPELKRRFGPADAGAFTRAQLEILERFAGRVRPGGILVFATCSFLPQEGESVAEQFSAAHPEFAPYESIWARKNLPASCLRGARIRIDPLATGTDAFFVALWERSGTG